MVARVKCNFKINFYSWKTLFLFFDDPKCNVAIAKCASFFESFLYKHNSYCIKIWYSWCKNSDQDGSLLSPIAKWISKWHLWVIDDNRFYCNVISMFIMDGMFESLNMHKITYVFICNSSVVCIWWKKRDMILYKVK
jgi:hypothetical protein